MNRSFTNLVSLCLGASCLLQADPFPPTYQASVFLDLSGGNPSLGAEGIEIHDGNMYLSRHFGGTIWKVTPEGVLSTYAQLDVQPETRMCGLEFNKKGELFVTCFSEKPVVPTPPNGQPQFEPEEPNGIYRIREIEGEAPEIVKVFPLHGEPLSFADGLTIDKKGNIYVSDSFWGRIWKFHPDHLESAGIIWSGTPITTPPATIDPSNDLQGLGLFGPPGTLLNLNGVGFGVNGLTYDKEHHYIYAANSERGKVVRMKIYHDGTAGAQEVVFFDSNFFLDGVHYDTQKNIIYVTHTLNFGTFSQDHQILGAKVHNHKPLTFSNVNNNSLLGVPTDIQDGRGFTNGNDLFVVNFGDANLGITPSIVKLTPVKTD